MIARRTRRRWLLTILITAWVVPTFASDDEAYDALNDLVYSGTEEDGLRLDLARPLQGEGPFPAIVVIHGGAWRTGNKAHHRPLLGDLARRGYVAISPQYRFCPKDKFPAQVHDVKAAVRWLRAHATEYEVDPERIGAMGFSAGGYLSLMLGVTGPTDGLEGDAAPGSPSSRVSAVVNYFGPTDLVAANIPIGSKKLLRDYLGGLPSEKPDVAIKASPVTFVSRDDPPILTFHGTKDLIVPFDQATRLAAAMNRSNVAGRTEIISGAGHGWVGREYRRTMDATYDFFDAHLKRARPATASPGQQAVEVRSGQESASSSSPRM